MNSQIPFATSTWPDCVRAGKLLSSSFVAVELNLFENPRSFDRTSWLISGYHGIPWYFSEENPLEKWLVNADPQIMDDDMMTLPKTEGKPWCNPWIIKLAPVLLKSHQPLKRHFVSLHPQQYHKSHKSIVVEREWCHMFWHSWVYSVLNKTVRPLLTLDLQIHQLRIFSSSLRPSLCDVKSLALSALAMVAGRRLLRSKPAADVISRWHWTKW